MFTTLFRRLRAAPAAAPADAAAEGADEPLRGCGWFDSSHELQLGLMVTEHVSPDAVAGDLPLADWLALHLCGWSEPSCVA